VADSAARSGERTPGCREIGDSRREEEQPDEPWTDRPAPAMKPSGSLTAAAATGTASAADAPAFRTIPAGAAVYMAVVQFLFVTSWTTYVIYLPQLLAAAGLPARYTPWLLLIDQLVFMATDIAVGLGADRARRTVGRLGPYVVGLTVVSCAAFVLLPLAVHLPEGAAPLGLALTLLWAATSSALRAPPWVLLGKYAWRPALPWMNTLMLIGLAAGGAIAPWLGAALKAHDPRLPFAVSSVVLLAATAGIVAVERALERRPPERPGPPEPLLVPRVVTGAHGLWLIGVLVLALGFQVHASLNSSAEFLRFAPASALERLLPLFWAGFAAGMLIASALCRRHRALHVMAVAALVGAVGAYGASIASTLETLIGAQLVTGAAWGGMLVAIFSTASDLGRTGREGLVLGTMFSMLAFATLMRIAVTIAGWNHDPDVAAALGVAPVVLWAAGAVLVSTLAWRARADPAAA
jgi:hypothetical protein